MINVLRVLQDDVEHFIQEKLNEYELIIEKEWKAGSSEIIDESYPYGFFRKKIRELNEK